MILYLRNTLMLLLLCCSVAVGAQSKDDKERTKKIEKINKFLEEKKYVEAEKLLGEMALANPSEPRIWGSLLDVQMKEYEHEVQMDQMMGQMMGGTVTIKDKDGKITQNDSLANQLQKMLTEQSASKNYMNHLINTCRIACCACSDADMDAATIRIYRIDRDSMSKNPDALKEFRAAEDEFEKQNYTAAAGHYQKAIDIDTGFYKARLYLGDVYYFTKRYDLAIDEFKRAVGTRPNLVEPRKYLLDALMKSGQYDKAYEAGIDGICVYPDAGLIVKTQNAAEKANVKFNFHWMARAVLPNRKVPYKEEKEDLVYKAPKNSPWVYYTKAKDDVEKYCDDNGLISTNKVTQQKYLEVYSWEQMLAKSNDPSLAFARKMKDAGYLDCYALISCFHYDCYDQFKDFVSNNRKKVKQYMELLKAQN